MPIPQPSILDRDPREILIIKPSSLGDIVHTLPAVTLVLAIAVAFMFVMDPIKIWVLRRFRLV